MGSAAPEKADDGVFEDGQARFDFEHKIFSAPGGCFRYVRLSKQAFFNLKIGEVNANIAINTLCNEFGIDEASHDGELLALMEKGIPYVGEIRPGDIIPSELLDGSASWSIDERHRDSAKLKLMAATLDWLDGGGGGTMAARMNAISQDEETQKRVNDALGKISEDLKLGDKQKVMDRFETLANELAYIEALRDHYAGVYQISKNLKMLQSMYGSDRGVAEELWRMAQLIEKPVEQIKSSFQQIDGHTEDIKSAIRNFEAEVEFIREMRDTLHIESMLWSEMLDAWKGVSPECSSEVEALLKRTYQFLAQNFAVARKWGR
ncbi:MAG: hypothetical protein AAF527_11035 [Pseudomonadota bacterium]